MSLKTEDCRVGKPSGPMLSHAEPFLRNSLPIQPVFLERALSALCYQIVVFCFLTRIAFLRVILGLCQAVCNPSQSKHDTLPEPMSAEPLVGPVNLDLC